MINDLSYMMDASAAVILYLCIAKVNNMAAKTTWSDISVRDKISYIVCVLSFVLAGCSFIMAMYIPPMGVVDPTVLTGVGMFLTFTGSILGISQHYKVKHEELNYKFEEFKQKMS